MNDLASTVLVGCGATVAVDLWAIVRRRWLGIALPNYGLVGRWVAHMPRGRFRHAAISTAQPIRGERWLGWAVHYLTGITFAGVLIGHWGPGWVRQPTLGPALLVGIASVLAPFLLMQPGMGQGAFASLAPRPGAARTQTFVTHLAFGIGLYAGGWVAQAVVAPG